MTLAVSGAFGQTAWVSSQRNGDEVRFLFGNQIQRYDLATKSWLPAVTLPRTGATAMAADTQGTAVAYGTSIYRYGTDFTGEALLGSTSSNIESLFFDGNLLIAVHSAGLYSRVKILNRTSGAQLSFVETYVDSLYGTSHAPQTNRLYGRTQGISPADIVTASYTDAGVAGNTAGSPYHGDYPSATRSWVFPNESRVVDSSGTVYTAPGLNYFGSFAGTITDIAFNGDVPVLLRGSELIAYTPNLLETGRGAAGVSNGAELQVTASEAFVFAPGVTRPSVSVVALSAINAQEPGTPTNPDGLAYTVDDAFPDKDGNLLLFSKGQQSLFRWSPSARQYTGSIPLTGVPKYAAYSRENHSAYFAYETQEIRKMDLSADKPKETPFVNLPTQPDGLATAGEFVFASDTSGAWGTHYVYSPAGALLHSLDWNYYSRVWEWDATKRRMYFFRDDTSPNDLHYETIDTTGKITGEGETPYHGDFTVTPPIRISPDSTKVVIGSGVAFNTDGLTKTANLANGFNDAVWSGGKLVTLRLINGLSQLQVWEGDQFLPGATVRQFSGTPVRMFNTSAGLCVVTSIEGTPRFTLLNAALETIYISPSRPVAPAAPAVVTRTENSISLAWQDMSDNEDSFRIEYRIGTGSWVTGTTTGSGVTNVVVSGLAAGTVHEFRVLAVNGTLVSTPSPGVSGKTLSSANEPVGEPYNLIASRIYNNRITLEWLDNANNETAFRIYRSTSSASLGTQLQAPANAVSYTDTGLTAGTNYYYRVQAVNGAVTGDLSAQVNARTLSSATVPTAPSTLVATVSGTNAVSLSWRDNSTNEDEFIVERSTSPALVWTELGRVPFNVKSYTDSTAIPNSGYSYRIKASNTVGASTSSTATISTPKLGGEFTGHSVRSGDVYHFAFSGPNRIERYNLASRTWLAAIPLNAAATALWADESGIFVAEDRSIVRFNPDGSTRTAMANGETTVKGLFTIGDVLAFQTGSSYTTLHKATAALFTSFSYGYSGTGFDTSPTSSKVFFRSSGVSPSDIHFMEIGADGKLVKGKESPYHGAYPSATRTFVFPNGSRVADDSGTVYSTEDLSYSNSLGGTLTDMDFHGIDVPVILRGDKLLSYSNTLLEAGSFTLGSAGLRLAVSGTDAVVFFADGADTRGLRVQSVPLSLLAAPEPGSPIDPNGLAFTPDEVFSDKDGNILMVSKSQLSLFRWSPSKLAYLPTLPLLGVPSHAAYSRENHSAYFAYPSQVVRKMDLSAEQPKETPFFNLPTSPNGLATAGEFVFASDTSGAWGTHYVYSPAGALLHSLDWNYYSVVWEWDAAKRRMYFFRNSQSPNDLHYETIDATGKITGEGETPYHGDFTVTPPIRISPDSSKVVIGSGVAFNTDGLTKTANLANGFSDAVWSGGKLVTLRLINGLSQLQVWEGDQFLPGATVRQFSGTPVRLFNLDSSRLLLITLVNGVPRFAILNENLEPTYISPTKPLAPATLAVKGRSTNSVTLGWQDNSDNETGFRIEYRTAAGEWTPADTTAANATDTTVAGLTPATLYEFRVSAIAGNLSSAPSSSVSALTLSSPDQPVGEPYDLRITRIFSDSLTLEWNDNAANETGFRIIRSATATGPTTSVTVPAGSTSYKATGLSAATTYYFRVQAENGAVTGDLSAQVNAATRSANSAPAAASNLVASAISGNSVSLTWKDNSLNEDSFVIERSGSPASTWSLITSVPHNTATFRDDTAVPNTAYSYRVKAVSTYGGSSYTTTTVTTPKLGGEFSGFSMRSGDVQYFAFSGPYRIERYDLITRSWLAPVPLQAAATALWVDESGIFVAEDRAVIRFALDGTARSPIGNGETTVRTLFTLKEVLVFGAGGQNLITMDKRSGNFLSNISYWYSGAGYSVAPGLNRVFFRSTGVSPSDIHYLEIAPDGKLVVGNQSPYHGDYASATRTFLFPNGARVADDSGTVYSTDSLTYTNSLGAAFTDLGFHGPDIPIILRSNKLTSYTNTLLESGSFTLSANGLRLAVAGADALVFIADGTTSNGLRVQTVPLNQLAAPVPGQPVDPRGVPYTPDEVFVDKNGELLIFSKAHLSLFRWSPRLREYLPSLPLLGSPKYAAYSKERHRAYFAYETQMVREMNLSADIPAESPLFTMSAVPRGLATAGEFIFADDESGAWDSHYVFSPEGQRLQAVEWNRYSRVWEWDPDKRRMYFFRDDTSPNDLHYETISTAGIITGKGETPYHGDFNVTPPIRVNPDGNKLVIGSGVVFETAGMTKLATLPNTFTDAMWRASELLTIRSSGGGTQIQRWNASTFAPGASVPAFTGTPLRLLALNAAESALITLVGGVPRIYLLNEDLSVAFTYESVNPTVPPTAVEDMPYLWKPTVLWQKLGTGPLTITAPVLPTWLKFENGILSGTPRDPDSGDPVNQSKTHRLVLRGVNDQNISEEKELSVSVVWRNDAPTFSPNPTTITANPRADDTHLDLKTLLADPDARDSHLWQVASVSNSSIFTNILLGADGMLDLSYTPYISGSSVIMVDVTDLSGASARLELNVTLPVLPAPKITVDPVISFNRSTGLYEQKVTVKNVAARAIAGFDLNVSGLRSGVSLHNATSTKNGSACISYRKPIAAGQSVVVTLKYYAIRRGAIQTPKIEVSLHTPAINTTKLAVTAPPKSTGTIRTAASHAVASLTNVAGSVPIQGDSLDAAMPALPFAINRIQHQPDGSVSIEFPGKAGKTYRMQYSADAVHWTSCPEIIQGGDFRIQWIDRGPPSTESPPASASRRFYRVQRIDP